MKIKVEHIITKIYYEHFIGAIEEYNSSIKNYTYSNTCVEQPLSKRPQIGFQDQLSLNAGQKYCRLLQVEHSATLSTFINLPFVIKIFVLSIFEWPFYTGFTVQSTLDTSTPRDWAKCVNLWDLSTYL